MWCCRRVFRVNLLYILFCLNPQRITSSFLLLSLSSFLCFSLDLSSSCSLKLGWIAASFSGLTMMKATGRAAHEKWRRHNEGWSTETMKKEREREGWLTYQRERREDERPILSFVEGTYWNQKKNQPAPENLKEREREKVCVRGFVPKPSVCFLHRQLPSKEMKHREWLIWNIL